MQNNNIEQVKSAENVSEATETIFVKVLI